MSVGIQEVFSEISSEESLDGLCLLMDKTFNKREFNPAGLSVNSQSLTEFVVQTSPKNSSRYFIERINGKIQLRGDSSDGKHFRVYYYGKK